MQGNPRPSPHGGQPSVRPVELDELAFNNLTPAVGGSLKGPQSDQFQGQNNFWERFAFKPPLSFRQV